MAVEIASALLLQLMRECWLGKRDEICGLLRGRGQRIIRVDRAANVALDPQRRFEIDPVVLIQAQRQARRANALQVLGYYHSHPGGRPEPSEEDARRAKADGRLWLIVTREAAQLWRAVERGARFGRFDAVPMDLVIGKRPAERTAGVMLRGVGMNFEVVETPPP